MFPRALERRIQYLVLFCVLSMTLVVTPWFSHDPINLPKLFILGSCGFAALGNLALYLKRMINSEARLLAYAVLFFLLSLTVVLFFSGAGTWSQIYGAYGRSTGLLAYSGLALMLLSVVFVSNLSFSRKLIWVLIVTGMANAVYGFIQWLGNDPVKWNNTYDPILGTLGNPNFVSAHLGIAGLASLALAVESSRDLVSRLILIVNVGLSLFVISQSSSSQGLLVFTLGATLILYFRFLSTLNLVLRFGYWLLVLVGSVVGTVGILNKGPLAWLLYQDSVTYRGDYWRAGWKMTLDNPLFGVGLDSYGDWYRFARTEAAALRRGPDVTSNSAHNVFLDISSNGGFLLLTSYLLILGLIFRSAIRVLKKSQNFDAVGVGLVSAWVAYLIQSVISINQLGLAIWGWVLGGAIIGYDLYRDRADAPSLRHGSGRVGDQVSPSGVLTGTLGLAVGIAVSIWPVSKDISFKSALTSGDQAKIELAANRFPQDPYTFVFASGVLLNNSLDGAALDLARRATELHPRYFDSWKILIQNSKISQEERDAAIAKMKELDPFNNTLDK